MTRSFFYVDKNVQVGPLNFDELKIHAASGRLRPDDRVFSDDRSVDSAASELAGLFNVVPPPLPPNVVAPTTLGSTVQPPPISTDKQGATESSPAVAGAAGTKSSQVAAVAKQVAGRVGAELLVTARACGAQAARLASYSRSWFGVKSAEKQVLAAREHFGRKLFTTGLGDPALRAQVEQLGERRRSVEAAKASTKPLDSEERGLLIRLAIPILESPTPPAGLEREYETARQSEESQVAAHARHQRQRLWPEGPANMARVIGGSCFTLFVLWVMGIWLFSGESVPPGSIKKEVWWDENDVFPRRLAVGKFVDDVPWGEVNIYDGQRRLMATFNYKDGQLDGTAKMFYPSGKKFHQGKFVHGKREGTHLAWFENGKLAQSLECRNGVSHGELVMYYDNGAKFTEGQHVDGAAEGQVKGYLPDGRLATLATYKQGGVVKEEDKLEPTPADLEAIDKRSKYPLSLKAHWQPGSVNDSSVAGTLPGLEMPDFSLPHTGGGGGGGSTQGVCSNCMGLGQANCLQCFGSGKRTCFACNGRGRAVNNMPCFQCNGTGNQNCSFCQFGKVQCPQCFGSGRK